MWFDTHCHLQKFFDRGDLERILSRSKESGVRKMVTVGTSTDDWDLYATLSKKYSSDIFYSVGLHPSYVNSSWEIQVSKLISYWQKEQ